MNIIRKIKLERLGYYNCKNNKEKELFEFIKEKLLNLKQVILKYYPDYIMYFKDDKCIFEQNLNSSWVYVNYHLICYIFETKFNYNHKETKQLIKSIVEQTYKLE